LKDLGVALVEQPLAEGDDEALLGFDPLVPLCADESCHDLASLDSLKGRYQAVNIKLDKTGGLSEATKMVKQAKNEGFSVFLGCMVSTSLAIAPVSLLWSYADYIDLDGAAWLKNDRDGGFKIEDGKISCGDPSLWGHPFSADMSNV
jgi:L-alanine-DL-glutamate epimerase-like enolase superfamily enzyme